MYTYARVKEMLQQMVALGTEPEFNIYLYDKDYMIIGYADHYSFQRCGKETEQSGEIDFSSLDELYHAVAIDSVCLEKDWHNIETMGFPGIDDEEDYQGYIKFLEDRHKPFSEVRPNLAREWDYERNKPLTPADIETGSDKKVWWQCPQGHKYRESPSSRYMFENSCPICYESKT